MKIIASIIFSAIIFPCLGQDQITLIGFEQKIRLNTADLKNANLIEASTTCNGSVNIDFEDKRFSGGCAGTIERTYTITDDCNNSKTAVQYITLEDTTPPVFDSKPGDITIESRTDLKNPITLVAYDESGNYATVTIEETAKMDDKDFVYVTRIWTATDPCDNVAIHQRVITIPRNRPETQNEGN